MRELLVAFDSRDAFVALREGLRQRCILVPPPDPPPDPLTEIAVRLRTPTGGVEAFRARVVQLLGPAGVVLAIEDPAAAERLQARLAEAEALPASSGETRVGWGVGPTAEAPTAPAAADTSAPEEAPEPGADDAPPEDAADAPPSREESASLADRIRTMTANEKMQLAAHGDRPSRLLLMKDPMRTVQTFLLQNPRIALEEIRALAGSRQSTPDVLQAIAAHRDWSQNPGVVTALVRNPRTPLGAAVRLLDRLPEQEIRRLSRSNDVSRGVQTAARKRLASGG